MEYSNPLSVFTENMKFIVGNGSADNLEGLFNLYTEAKLEPAYQLAQSIVQLFQSPTVNKEDREDYGGIVQPIIDALQEYNKSAKTISDKNDFIWSIEYEIKQCGLQ